MKGLINLNKPKGWTSRDAVNKVRNLLGVKEVGHMGTLDPQGEGVLLIGVGKATRLFDALLSKDKVYRADFTFGYETDTLDGDGATEATTDTIPTRQDIEKILPTLIGKIAQLPPKYSAKNVDGSRAYDLARRGADFTLPPSNVEIYSIDIVASTAATFTFDIHCSSGTYIRSLCRDMAYALGSLATMTAITRLRSGSFTLDESHTIEEIATLKERALITIEDATKDFERLDLADEYYTALSNGVKINLTENPRAPFAVYCRGELFGLGRIEDGRLKISAYLRD